MSEKPDVDPHMGDAPADLEVTDLVEGDGAEATSGSTVSVHYVGVAHSSGEEFDASYNRGDPLQFRLGIGQVISGWDTGVQGMKVGGRRGAARRPAHLTGGPDDDGAGSGCRPRPVRRGSRRGCSRRCAQRTSVRSTTKISVSPGLIAAPAPRSP